MKTKPINSPQFTLQNLSKSLIFISNKKSFWIIILSIFTSYACYPIFYKDIAINTALSSREFTDKAQLLKSIVGDKKLMLEERVFLYPLTPFSQVSIEYSASWSTNKNNYSDGYVHFNTQKTIVSLRIDQIILFGAMIIMLAFTISTLSQRKDEFSVLQKPDTSLITQTPQLSTARLVFAQEVKFAEYRAETLFKRSTYLLTGGVLMAFVGVAIFYATLPEPRQEEVQTIYWIRALRSTGMLMFLEAIAWFLLRQYRSLIEDFKSFHRIYMKRANYLAAITILEKEKVRSEDLLVIGALLGEDFSGKLITGETTESLESIKNEGVNPVFNLIHDALGKAFSKSSQNDPSK